MVSTVFRLVVVRLMVVEGVVQFLDQKGGM